MQYKVTNKLSDVRKFRDNHVGRDIFVEPKKSVITTRPPSDHNTWKIELAKDKPVIKVEEKKEKKQPKEDDE